ncbi:MAG: hypothetical protein JKY52_09445 [Flavobacteriales bacterium]|nr:hypothetical protein [Flavobacteriales bacterium]
MKHFISLCLLVSFFTTGNVSAQSFCTTPSNIPDLLQTIPPGNLVPAKFGHDVVRIFVHIMRRADGTGGQSFEEVEQALNILYSDYDQFNICFDLVGWDEIEDDVLFNGTLNFNLLTGFMNANRIDLFVFDNGVLNSGKANGIPGNALVVGGDVLGSTLVSSRVISHEMGHCLGLFHTFHGHVTCEGGSCAELVDGSNCTTCGDFVCDTPSDPKRFNTSVTTCNWNGTANCTGSTTDANGDTYVPPTDLIMAYLPPNCMQFHTAGQGTRMKDMIANSTLLQATLSNTDPSVLYMKDNPNDFGLEPNNAAGLMYISEDMWIRQQNDGLVNQFTENAEYRDPSFGVSNYIYVRIRNKGCVPSLGTEKLTVNWARAATASAWDVNWNNFFEDGILYGDRVAATDVPVAIPVINPGESAIIEVPWFPTDPSIISNHHANDHAGTEEHYCLVARIETSPTFPFGMTVPEGTNINTNTINNRKVIWKNISVVDEKTGGDKIGPIVVRVRNVRDVPTNTTLKFAVPKEEKERPFLDEGSVMIDLGPELFQKWVQGGRKGTGFEEVGKFNHMSPTGIAHNHSPNHALNVGPANTIRITSSEATLENLLFDAHEHELVELVFNYEVPDPSLDKIDQFNYDVIQFEVINGVETILGGVRYQINRPECELADAGMDATIPNNGARLLSASPIIFNAEYTWREEKSGNLVGTGTSVIVSPNVTTDYELEIADPNGCITYDVITITVDKQLRERLKVAPNPGKDHVVAVCDLKNAQTARLEVRNVMSGQLEKLMNLDVKKKSFPVWIGDLQNGPHTCLLYADNVLVASQQLIKTP